MSDISPCIFNKNQNVKRSLQGRLPSPSPHQTPCICDKWSYIEFPLPLPENSDLKTVTWVHESENTYIIHREAHTLSWVTYQSISHKNQPRLSWVTFLFGTRRDFFRISIGSAGSNWSVVKTAVKQREYIANFCACSLYNVCIYLSIYMYIHIMLYTFFFRNFLYSVFFLSIYLFFLS